MLIMAAHRIPYAATASVAYPEDLVAKVKTARATKGTRFIHLLTPCPPGWRVSSEQTVKLARMAVQTRIFPLYEIEGGRRYRLQDVSGPASVEDYLRAQGRFGHLSVEEIRMIERDVLERWDYLKGLAAITSDGSQSSHEPVSRTDVHPL